METVLEERKQYRKLNISRLKNRKIGTMSSEEALKDIIPIKWTDNVLNGREKVIISRQK